MTAYKRILLKLSGEALSGDNDHGIDHERLNEFASQIGEISKLGVQIGIVIGGGNMFRGLSWEKAGFDRVSGDYMGMLATVINGLAFQSALRDLGTPARLFTAIPMEPVGERYNKIHVTESLEKGEVAIFSFGTGNPYFTTDTAAALRAVEMQADALLKGTRVDGVYNADPEKDAEAVKFDSVSFDRVIELQLKVMDQTAFTLCRENSLPIIVFNMTTSGNLLRIVKGEKVGTIIEN